MPCSSGPAGHQRAKGELVIGYAGSGLRQLRQAGCLKALFPRPEPGTWPTAVMLNTGGGVVGGDQLDIAITAEGCELTVTSQAAERFYRALPGSAPAQVATRLHVGAAASLDWLPQEAIVFHGASLERSLDVELVDDAGLLLVEQVLFGRTAMGEQVRALHLRDRITVRRNGRLLLQDMTRMDGDAAALLDRTACGKGARGVATLIATDATRLDSLREALAGADAGASAIDGLLVARIVAPSGALLRRAVLAGLVAVRGARPLPRIWTT